MSKTNEYYRLLQEDEEFKKQEKEIDSLVDDKVSSSSLTKEQLSDLKEYKKYLSMLVYSKKNFGAKGNA